MKELRDYINEGIEKAGSLTALGLALGQSQPNMSHFRSQHKRMPIETCVKLADYIGADLRTVIAANELATEKKEEKRQFWRPFVESAKAASIVLALAGVTNLVTPSTAKAAPPHALAEGQFVLCQIRRKWQAKLDRRLRILTKRIFKALAPFFEHRVTQV